MAKKSLEAKVIDILKEKKLTVSEIAQEISTKEESIDKIIKTLREKHYSVVVDVADNAVKYYMRTSNDNENSYIIGKPSNKLIEYKCGLTGDWHAGCVQFDGSGLEKYLKECVQRGVKDVFVAGDLVDGYKVYRGQLNNLVAWKIDDQVAIVADVLNRFPDLHFYAIGGNHDYSFEQHNGANPLALLETKIKNFTNLGNYKADVIIHGVFMRVLHGDGGAAYAKSYPGQKYLRSLMGGAGSKIHVKDKFYELSILHLGHYHTEMKYNEFGVAVYHNGNFQRPNDFTTRRGLVGPRGGRIVEMDIVDGKIHNLVDEWVPTSVG
ncbi:MAG TPA: metallophosphoesterase [Candidatus Nanoarchaeia archaeon]|nr:metallophosphoesterase [Candidatus Nanoarchaeia archaeon]